MSEFRNQFSKLKWPFLWYYLETKLKWATLQRSRIKEGSKLRVSSPTYQFLHFVQVTTGSTSPNMRKVIYLFRNPSIKAYLQKKETFWGNKGTSVLGETFGKRKNVYRHIQCKSERKSQLLKTKRWFFLYKAFFLRLDSIAESNLICGYLNLVKYRVNGRIININN